MFRGERDIEVETIKLPSYEESVSLLKEKGLLIHRLPTQISQSFLGNIAGRELSPQEIALNWAQARDSQAGNPEGFSGALQKFILDLHGVDVITAVISDKRLANKVIIALSSAYKEVAKQS